MATFISHLAVAVVGNILIWGAIGYMTLHSAALGIAHVINLLH